MADPQKRGRGRPPLVPGDRSVAITVAIPAKRLEQLFAQAKQQRRDIRDHIRMKLSASSSVE